MSEPFKKDAGSKSVYETVTTVLRNDAVLKGLVNYTPKLPNIRRGFQTDGEWKSLVVYYLQPEVKLLNSEFSPAFRQVPLIVSCYVRENELTLHDIGERVIQLLDGADLSKEGYVRVFNSQFDGEINGVLFDESKQAFNRTLRFVLTFRKEA